MVKKLTPLLIILCVSYIVRNIYANPISVIPTQHGLSFSFWFVLMFIAPTVYIEFLVLKWFLHVDRNWLLFFIVTAVHIISYPLTYFVSWAVLYAAELVPILLEPVMYNRIFSKCYEEDKIAFTPKRSKVWLVTFCANMVTFLIGIGVTLSM